MTPRENLLSCLRRRGYESVPFIMTFSQEMEDAFARRTGLPGHDYYSHYGIPIRWLFETHSQDKEERDWIAYGRHTVTTDRYANEWGIVLGSERFEAIEFLTHSRHPMDDYDSEEQFHAFPWPEVVTGADDDAVRQTVASFQQSGLAVGAVMHSVIWEAAWYLRGMERLTVDMGLGNGKAGALFDHITAIAEARARKLAGLGVDVLLLCDDIGLRHHMMLDLSLWTEWIQPRLAAVIAAAREASDERLLVCYHSCGRIDAAVPGLIAAGVDVLNPMEPPMMELAALYKDFGERLSFLGTISTDQLLWRKTPEQIRQTIACNLDLVGPAGGLVPTPTHLLRPHIPWDNIDAMVQACREYASSGA